jgi:PhnB protein
MHVSLPIGGGATLMATDALESMGQKLTTGDNFSIFINTGSEAEADKIFGALGQGGQVNMPLAKTFWGAYFGTLTDQFGIQWMVNYNYKQD